MAIERVFLGHDRPALVAAAEYLFERFGERDPVDMRPATLVVPGGRAGRRLLEILVQQAASRSVAMIPPQITTVGRLPELLYLPKRPFATDLVQQLVWAEVLRQASPDDLLPVIPSPPAAEDTARWLALAELLRRQHAELAGDNLSFADVAHRGDKLDGFPEHARWHALQRLQDAYLKRLDELELWDLQTARLKAIEFKECQTESRIVLIGAVDLNVTQRKMLDHVADQITALVFAPRDWQDRFDEHGCLIAERWRDVPLPIQSDQVAVVDGPSDQALAVVRGLYSWQDRYRADEVVIGVPDEQLIPDIERRLGAAGVTGRWGPGESFARTAPFRLLEAIASYLESQRFPEFAALVRHPDLESYLARSPSDRPWLLQLDEFQNRHLPYQLTGKEAYWEQRDRTFGKLLRQVHQLLGELRRGPRPLQQWSEPLWQLFWEIYGNRPLELTQPADASVKLVGEGVRGVLQSFERIPAEIMPEVTASRAIRFVLDDLRSQLIPAAMQNDAVEMLGWLELPLDDAPAVIVTSFNEGFVPESVNADLFLPNALRQQLGLLDNARRYARDAYAVSLLSATKQVTRWIVGRRNHEGDPLIPSRLLFACDPETAAQRALELFQPVVAETPPAPKKKRAADSQGDGLEVRRTSESVRDGLEVRRTEGKFLEVPKPRPLAVPIERLRVTAFRDYLACPYRFYLRHVLRLDTVTDELDELDGGAFGSLAHEVVRRFGLGDVRHATDPEAIARFLERELDAVADELFGGSTLPVVRVQVEQLRWRLRAFAAQQAAWCAQGWQIEHIEAPAERDHAAVVTVDGEPMRLSGRIDRIDVHAVTGVRMILDYKTSDSGLVPARTHQRGGAWVDLQLPLYRHIAESLGISGPFQFGYILLPKDTGATQFAVAAWGESELQGADEVAWEVVRRIRRQEFWPPANPAPDFSEDFSPICQDAVLR